MKMWAMLNLIDVAMQAIVHVHHIWQIQSAIECTCVGPWYTSLQTDVKSEISISTTAKPYWYLRLSCSCESV